MSGITHIFFDEGAIHELLTGPLGPVAKDLEKRAQRVQNAAVRLCPVDSGRLKSSITHSLAKDAEGLFAIIGTDVEYGGYVEFGTSKMPAQPYLRPALELAGNAGSTASEVRSSVSHLAKQNDLTKTFSGTHSGKAGKAGRAQRNAATHLGNALRVL